VVVIAFEAAVAHGSFQLNPEALEIEAFAPAAIPWEGIGFTTTRWALHDWLRLRHPELQPPSE